MIRLRNRLRPPLCEFVDCLWYSDGIGHSHVKERLLPTGSVDILFKLHEAGTVRVFNDESDATPQVLGGAVVSAAYTRPFALDKTNPSPTLGVHFRPGGVAPFLGFGLSELTDQHINLEELWGRQALAARERLMMAESVSSMFDVVEQVLLGRLNGPRRDDSEIREAIRIFSSANSISVKAVSDMMGSPPKRFIRRFHDAVGLTPKMYCRIHRFQAVLDRIVGGQKLSWADVAVENGYYDQSHLIRDFRAFTNMTPLEYMPVASDRKNHIVLNS